MKYWSRIWFIFLVALLVMAVPVARADEDPPSYRISVTPAFEVSGKNYGSFETPVYELDEPLDTLMVAADVEKAPGATVNSYVRFRYAKTGKWTRFESFDAEAHFADVNPVSAWQMVFVVYDPSMGTTRVNRYIAQGRRMGEEMMEAVMAKTVPLHAANVCPKPTVVSRAAWNARPPKGEYRIQTPLKIVLHHSWQPAQAQYKGAATIRGIQNYHMDDPNTGWADIGYHFLIGPDGVIYQGRPENALGAHCPPNTNMVGICMIGNYDPGADPVNAKMEASLVSLLSWLSSTYKIDPRTQYYGHRNFSSKTCPGDGVYNRMSYYREEVLKNTGMEK